MNTTPTKEFKMSAFFCKLEDGAWGVRVMGDKPEAGTALVVSKRSGDTSTVTVTEVVSPANGGWLCRFVDGAPDKPAPAARKERTFAPTAEQVYALELFRNGDSLAVKAGAGTGKTSTLVILGEDADSRGLRGQYIAFNRPIVEESRGKFPASVSCDTAHSLAYRAVGTPFTRRQRSGVRMKSHEIAALLNLNPITVTKWNKESVTLTSGALAGLVMKAVLRFCQTADAEPTWRHVPLVDGLDAPPSPDRPTNREVNRYVAQALEPAVKRAWSDLCMYEGKLPFTLSTAMAVYLKLWQLSAPRINADYILFDEAQDASPVMVDVIKKQTHAQLVWVGDDNQQIYSFTGAINALATVDAKSTAMLTQSFRFGPSIAEVANQVLSTLPTTMQLVGTEQINSRVQPIAEPRAILTRTNATAIRAVMTAIANNQIPFLVGGGAEVSAFCKAARALQSGQRTEHPELACFSTWGEVQEYVEFDEQGDDLRLMVALIDEFTVETILTAISGCGKDEDADVTISTAHKSKGREWDSVQIGADFPPREKMGDEERRLLYVAVTRAKLELDITAVEFFMESEPVEAEEVVAS